MAQARREPQRWRLDEYRDMANQVMGSQLNVGRLMKAERESPPPDLLNTEWGPYLPPVGPGRI